MNSKLPAKEHRRTLSPFLVFGLFLLLASYVVSIYHVIKIQSDQPDEEDGDRIVIRLAHFLSEENVMEAFNKLARDYEELHPEVRIIIQSVPKRAYQQWLNTQQIGRTTPDLFQLEERGNWTMASRFQEVLTSRVGEVNPYNAGTGMEGVPWRNTYTDGMEGGYFYSLLEFYGIPLTVETVRIFYNKDLFREATGSDAPPRNFQHWMEICAAIKEYARQKGEKIFPIAVTREDVKQNSFHNYYLQSLVVYKKRMLFCIFSCTNSVRQFILSAWLLKLLIVGTVEVKISLNLARRPTINSATAAMIVVNKAAKTPQ